jgi:hypothetical protein
MEPETRENFLKHMDKFEYDEPKEKWNSRPSAGRN